MAEFRQHYDEIRGAASDVAALSVDDAGQSETVRALYDLPFPVLCDPQAEVVKAWGLYDANVKGGIAKSAVYVIDTGLRVQFASVDTTISRVRADGVLEYLRATAAGAGEPPRPPRRVVVPTVGELVKTVFPALRLTLFPPKRP